MLPRVYSPAGCPSTWEQKLTAATLWLGRGAALSHSCASLLWGFPGCNPGSVEISHPGTSRSRRGVRVHRSVHLLADEVTRNRGFRLTSPARTLADMSGRLRPDDLHAALHYCLHQRIATFNRIQEACVRHTASRRPGATALRTACEAYSTSSKPTASHLEARLLRRLVSAGLPAPTRQHEVRLGNGTRRYLDFAWPESLVGLEADGYRWHSSRDAWRNDRQRLADLRRAGWTIVHASEDDVRAGAHEVVAELRELLSMARIRR